MKKTTVSLMLLLAPAVLFAQAGGKAAAQANGSTAAKSGGAKIASSASASADEEFHAPKGFSAEGAAKMESMFAEAKEHRVPRELMAKRVDEGRAKGASEAKIIVSVAKVKANLEASHDAMVEAGRAHPGDDETERGASAMERGVTKAQIKSIAKGSKEDRSLVVAFDVLAKLAEKGVPVGQAVAAVQANVTRGDNDASLNALVNTMGAKGSGTNATASATGTATAATKPVSTTVGATVGGVVKKP